MIQAVDYFWPSKFCIMSLGKYNFIIMDVIVLIVWLLVWLGVFKISVEIFGAYMAATVFYRIQEKLNNNKDISSKPEKN